MPLSLTMTLKNAIVIETGDGPVRIELNEARGGQAHVTFIADRSINIRREDRCDSPSPSTRNSDPRPPRRPPGGPTTPTSST